MHIYDITWGEAVDVKDFINFLSTLNVEVKAVFSQYRETPATVLHPTHKSGNAISRFNSNIYFIVNGVSCVSAVDVDINRDKIDIPASDSQKTIMLPPGLAFVAYSHHAKEHFKEVTMPKFYLGLNKYVSLQTDNPTPFTPNMSLLRGVNACVETVKTEGFSHVIARHYAIRNALRSALKALDLTLLVNDKGASPTVTAFKPNTNDKVKTIRDELKNCFKMTIAGGQGYLKGQILRIGHTGRISPFDISSVVSTLKIILAEHRKVSYIGKGISKYMEIIHEAV